MLIIPFYQPIFNLSTGKIYGHEILMRGIKDNVVLPAKEFITDFERNNKIIKISKKNIKKALIYKKNNTKFGKCFINFSFTELSDKNFLKWFQRLVADLCIPPSEVCCEITERKFENFEIIKDSLLFLTEKGFNFALDDFGNKFSGYIFSALFLNHLPIHYLKIDKNIIQNLNKETNELLTIIKAFCKKNKIAVIVEGIENKEILHFLQKIQIPFGQGFFLGKPEAKIDDD